MQANAIFDAVRLIGAYLVALVIISVGLVILYETRAEAVDTLQLAVAGFIGSALTFVFGQESGARATRAAHDSMTKVPIHKKEDIPPTTS